MERRFHRPAHLVVVEFLDHFTNQGSDTEPFKMCVAGFLYAEDEHYYHIATCVANEDYEDKNSECFGVLKKTLTKPLRKIRV